MKYHSKNGLLSQVIAKVFLFLDMKTVNLCCKTMILTNINHCRLETFFVKNCQVVVCQF